MDVRAAVAAAAGKPLASEFVRFDGARAGEVPVEIKATGIDDPITRTLAPERINNRFERMQRGEPIRSVVVN